MHDSCTPTEHQLVGIFFPVKPLWSTGVERLARLHPGTKSQPREAPPGGVTAVADSKIWVFWELSLTYGSEINIKDKTNWMLQTESVEKTAGVVLVLTAVNCHAASFSLHR